jgi:glycine/betaine/sarcosine/D-proline reductase family selenoprotein B
MEHDTPLLYIDRIRNYYQILGYGAPYEWAHFDKVPFTPFVKSLTQSTVGIITTAALYDPDKGEQGPGAAYNGSAKFYSVYSATTSAEPDLRISHIAYDRVHSMAQDQGAYFPLQALKILEKAGEIGKVATRFHGLPTNRSQRTTTRIDCVEIVSRCREDQMDAVILVPNCPVCHQSVSLAARALEEDGIPTVIMGSAKDIVEYVGVPRLLFNNFPLGNSAGLPKDPDSQIQLIRLALELLLTATNPRTTQQSPIKWNGKPDWQQDYSNGALLNEDDIAKRRAEFDKNKETAKGVQKLNE